MWLLLLAIVLAIIGYFILRRKKGVEEQGVRNPHIVSGAGV